MMKLLIDARNSKDLSQQEVAYFSGISRQFYNFIELGQRRPSPEVAKRIAQVLGFADEWYKLLEKGANEDSSNEPPAA